MRWDTEVWADPKEGMTRTRTGFLWIPRVIDHKWRWLEEAAWKETIVSVLSFSDYGPTHELYWKKIEWLEIPTKEDVK